MISKLADLGFETGLIVTKDLDENLYLASAKCSGCLHAGRFRN